MNASNPPAPPAGLAATGRALWRAVTKAWVLDDRELTMLRAACHQADQVAALGALVARSGLMVDGSNGQPRLHPAVAEARQGRLAVERLLGSLRLPAEDVELPATIRSLRAQHAARARWLRETEKKERRRGA